ncbi:MAG: hypothetical protein GXP49_17545 [Deltaproteobacteria bacterium]|nr:hypothetical protein [Deltaproteobacteria bacterium]
MTAGRGRVADWLLIVSAAAFWGLALALACNPVPGPISDLDWDEAEKIVDRDFGADDAVLISEGWLKKAGNRFKGKPLMLGMPASPAEVSKYSRIWVVSLDRKLPGGISMCNDAEWKPAGRDLWITKAVAGSVKSNGTDFMTMLAQAKVYLEAGKKREACDNWQGGNWYCKGPKWNHVGPVEQVVAGKQRVCIWAHPRSKKNLVISFDSVDTGKNLNELKGGFGLSDAAATTPGGMPVRFSISIDGKSMFSKTIPNRIGWYEYKVPLGNQGRHRVDFVVYTGMDGKRHFCFTARAGAAGANR